MVVKIRESDYDHYRHSEFGSHEEDALMKKQEYAISELRGVAVYDAQKPTKRLGKVHSFVFHPRKRKVVGFTVKRPDIALMVHRPELFVAFDGFDIKESAVRIREDKASTGKAACKRLGVAWDECIIWQGLPLITEDNQRCGYVGDVVFRTEDGSVVSLRIDRGVSAELLLGSVEVPAEYIKGFALGVGDVLVSADGDDETQSGAIVVSADVMNLDTEGGLAQKAGTAAAVASNKVSHITEKTQPVVSDVARKTGDAVNKGAYAVGLQMSKTKGMFASFKEEYRRARYDEEE